MQQKPEKRSLHCNTTEYGVYKSLEWYPQMDDPHVNNTYIAPAHVSKYTKLKTRLVSLTNKSYSIVVSTIMLYPNETIFKIAVCLDTITIIT